MTLSLPVSLTPSKVSSFKNCALAFRLSVIDALPEPPSVPATKGSIVHRALQLLFGEDAGNRTIPKALEALARARIEATTDPEYIGLGLGQKDEAAFYADAETLVRRYFDLEDPNRVHAIGLELRMEVQVGSLTLRGIIDRLDLDDGNLVVTDYKTGRAPGERYEHSSLAGVHFYALLCERVLGVRPVRVQLLHLREPVAISVEPNDQSIRALERRTRAIWTAIERACETGDFRPKPGPLCNHCAFRDRCPAWS